MCSDNRLDSPDALMLLGTHCPHCPAVLQGLSELLKSGELGSLKVVNIEQRPEIAKELGVRSVPWVRIGLFELAGLHTRAEYRRWAQRVGTKAGLAAYLNELLAAGKIDPVVTLLAKDHSHFVALLVLLTDPDTKLNVRVGIGAVMEYLQAGELLQSMVMPLGELTRHTDARVRSDACHYLGLSGSQKALPFIRPLLDDPSDEVKEIAQDTLELLGAPGA
ncbi:MAG: HEAT repeat domain-containing protein [Gammaproteobacteria bacterium]